MRGSLGWPLFPAGPGVPCTGDGEGQLEGQMAGEERAAQRGNHRHLPAKARLKSSAENRQVQEWGEPAQGQGSYHLVGESHRGHTWSLRTL